jgi:hypothetical protein
MSITTFVQEICRHLEWDLQVRIKPEPEEKLHASYRRGALSVTTSNHYLEIFAAQTFASALKANTLGFFLGESHPKYSLRALWLKNKAEEDPELMLQWIIGCGFNCVLGDAIPQALLRKYGLHDLRLECLEDVNPEVYETQKEALVKQLFDKRDALFYIKSELFADGQEEWLCSVLDDMGPASWLAVAAEHPFWRKLCEIPDGSTTPLAFVQTPIKRPCMHGGMQQIKGGIIEIDFWPEENSLESKNLWTAGQSLWWGLLPEV